METLLCFAFCVLNSLGFLQGCDDNEGDNGKQVRTVVLQNFSFLSFNFLSSTVHIHSQQGRKKMEKRGKETRVLINIGNHHVSQYSACCLHGR